MALVVINKMERYIIDIVHGSILNRPNLPPDLAYQAKKYIVKRSFIFLLSLFGFWLYKALLVRDILIIHDTNVQTDPISISKSQYIYAYLYVIKNNNASLFTVYTI